MKINRLFLSGAIGCALAFQPLACGAEPVRLTLADSIHMALESDESIESAEAQREASEHAFHAARRSHGPSVNWSSQAYRIGGRDYQASNDAHDAYGSPHTVTQTTVIGYLMNDPDYPVVSEQTGTVGSHAYHNTFANSWNLTVPLYTGGQLEGRIDAARYQLNRADLDTENTRQEVRYRVAEAYANVIYRENLALVAQEAVNKGNTQLELVRAMFEEGSVAEADLLMMKVNVANYQQALVSANAAVEIAKATLAAAVGLPQDSDVEAVDMFSYEPYHRTLPECENYALEHRPDGLAADYDIKTAEAQKDSAAAGYRPQVSVAGSQNIADNKPFRSERSNAWSLGLTFSWNVFDNGVTAENVRQAEATTNAYEAAKRKIKKNILLETRSAYVQMKAAETNIATTKVAVQQAEDSHIIAQVRYEEGVDGLLPVTDAQEKLAQARSNYQKALYEYNLSRSMLEKAMGVPVKFDAKRYRELTLAGASANRAEREASLHQEKAAEK